MGIDGTLHPDLVILKELLYALNPTFSIGKTQFEESQIVSQLISLVLVYLQRIKKSKLDNTDKLRVEPIFMFIRNYLIEDRLDAETVAWSVASRLLAMGRFENSLDKYLRVQFGPPSVQD